MKQSQRPWLVVAVSVAGETFVSTAASVYVAGVVTHVGAAPVIVVPDVAGR